MLLVIDPSYDVSVALAQCVRMLAWAGGESAAPNTLIGIWLGDPQKSPLPHMDLEHLSRALPDDRLYVQSSTSCGAWALLRLWHCDVQVETMSRKLLRRRVLDALWERATVERPGHFIPLMDHSESDHVAEVAALRVAYRPLVSTCWLGSVDVLPLAALRC